MNVADLFARLGIKVNDKQFNAANDLINKTGQSLATMGKWAAAAIGSVAGVTVAIANQADEVGATAEKLGVNAQRYQELGFAAQQSDTSIETLTMGLGLLSKNLIAAQDGSKEAADSFKDLGLDPKQFKTADEAFVAIADKLSKLPAGAKKTALSMKLFGKSGKELVPLLNIGREGIQKFAAEANALGLVMDDAGLQAGSDFGDSMNRVKQAVGGLLKSAILPLLPVITKLMDGFKDWVLVNRGLIKSKIAEWVQTTISALKTLAGWVHVVADNFGVIFAAAVGVKAAQAVYALTVALKAAGVTGVKAAVGMAASWLAAMAPFILIGAAIFLLILIVQDLYTWFQGGESVIKKYLWEPIKAFVGDTWTSFKMLVTDVAKMFSDMVDGIVDKLFAIPDAIGNFFSFDENTSTAQRGGAPIGARGLGGGPAGAAMSSLAPTPGLTPARSGEGNSSSVVNASVNANISVTSPNPEEAGKAVQRELSKFWGAQMREAQSG
jgi:hypothetical protein